MALVRMLTIQAKSRESAFALMDALSQFEPMLWEDETGAHHVSVLGGEEEYVLVVLDSVRDHFASRVGGAPAGLTVGVGVDDPELSAHDR